MSALDLFRLDGRVAVVTGASSGLGVRFALALAEAGADIVLAGRRLDRLTQTQTQVGLLGRSALAVPTDVADPAQCAELVDQAMARFGRVDILVNNAGIGAVIPALHEPAEGFRQVLEVNLNGSFWTAQAFARAAPRGSSVINIGSVLGSTTVGLPHAAYATSKAAIAGLTRDLAAQWTGRRGIRVNCLAPGFFPSEMTDQYPDGFLDSMASGRTLMRRLGDPEELAATLIWLASPASGYVTGQTIYVDGGVTIT